MNESIKEFSELVETYGRLFRCNVCFHDYSGEIFKAGDAAMTMHMSPFCQLVKKGRLCEKACIDFDSSNVRHFFSCGKKDIVKICHAGALEFVSPVYSGNRLCGALFVGPFRAGGSGKADMMIMRDKPGQIPEGARKLLGSLPEMKVSQYGDMLRMTRLLSEKLSQMISSFSSDHMMGQGYKEKIGYFINREFKNPISIANLAEFLSLSVSRTSRLVKIHTGRNFPDLLAERRIVHAKFLLENSFFTMALVSSHCGFSDTSYFFRTFRKIQKITPAEHRRIAGKAGNRSV